MPASTNRPEQSWSLAACQLAGVVAPLAFHTLGALGFESTKTLLIRILALAMLFGWLGFEAARLGGTPGPFAWRGALRQVWGGPLQLAIIGVGGIALTTALSTLASILPFVSLLGSWDRQQGLATVLAWLVLGVTAAVAGREPEQRRGVLTVWAAASAPVCVYAFVQYAHLDPVNWLHQPLGVVSALGSSTVLATYLAMLFPITLALAAQAASRVLAQAADTRPRSKRAGGWHTDPRLHVAGFAALLAAQAATLAMTQVRAGLLAVTAGLLVTVAFVFWPTHRRLVLVGGSAACALLVLASFLFAVVPRPDTGDGEDTSARQRVLVWQDAVQTVFWVGGPRLVIGYGPETQMTALEPRYPVELASRFENQRFDRAHNLWLDTLLTTGFLGLAALLAALLGVLRAGLLAGATEHGVGRWLPSGLLGALAANLTANQFAFDTVVTGVLFWMLAGLTVAPLLPTASPAAVAVARAVSRRKRSEGRSEGLTPAVRMRATAMLAVAAIGLATLPWLAAPFLADLYHTRALALRAGEAPGSASQQELLAARSAPWLDVPLLAVSDTFLDIARSSTLGSSVTITKYEDLFEMSPSSRAALFESARVTLERAAEMNPRDPYAHAYLGRHWTMRAEASRDPAEQADLYGKAVEAYDQAIAAGPSRVGFYDESGVALTRWGKPALALERFRQAQQLSRPSAERLSRMADAVLAQGDTTMARSLYQQALMLDPRSAPADAGLARMERTNGNLPAALTRMQRASRNQMRNWEYQRDLAVIQRELGENAEALVSARTARRLAPAWELDDLNALIQSVSG